MIAYLLFLIGIMHVYASRMHIIILIFALYNDVFWAVCMCSPIITELIIILLFLILLVDTVCNVRGLEGRLPTDHHNIIHRDCSFGLLFEELWQAFTSLL